MIKKHIRLIIIALVVVAATAVSYFAVIRPFIDSRAYVEEPPETLEGEVLGTSNRYYMYSSISRDIMKSIEVSNENGGFKFVKNSEDVFELEDHKGLAIDEKLLSTLVTTCGSTLSKTKVMDNAGADKLKEYGLDEPKAYWIVTDKNDKQYKVLIGRELLTGGGYYCMFAGRASVYVLGSTVAESVLVPVESYVTPLIMFGVSEDDYYTIDNFTVYKGKDKFISVGIVPRSQMNNKDALVENVLTYPAPYVPQSENLFGIYMGFTAFSGDSTYKLDPTEETLEECGLKEPAYTVSFEYGGKSYYFFVSELQEDGTYYVISNIYSGIISKISADKLRYLEYGIMDWISPYIFQYYITSVDEFSVKTKDIDVTFKLLHGTDEKGNPTLQALSSTGVTIAGQNPVDNFRQYYKALLSLQVQDYLPETVPNTDIGFDDFTADDDNCNMTFSYKSTEGKVTTYKFYRYSTRRSAVVIDGEATFYVLSDLVEKIANDTLRVLNGESVEAYGKN